MSVCASHSGINLGVVEDSRNLSTVFFTSVILFPLISSLIIVISVIIICQMKLKNRRPDDIEARKASVSHTNAGKQIDDTNKNVPVALNKAYANHNVSRCIQVSSNEAYEVSKGKRNDEPVYELVK